MMNRLPQFSRNNMIRDVWAENLDAEFRIIRDLIADYPFVAMDTEFPGVVAKPVGTFRTTHEFYYQTLRCNVNLLKIIQLGITLFNERGEVPDKCCTWQFNFRFSLTEDIYAQDSIELLRNGGINFDYMASHGVDMSHFAELLISSGLVLNEEVTWLAFHAGYDFGYLVRLAAARDLPEREEDFTRLFHLYFPSVYDIKFMLRQTDISHSLGLDALSDSLGLRRVGTAHQAGSDSLLTGHSFFKLLRDRFAGVIPTGCSGVLYGLNEDSASNATPLIPARSSPSQLNNQSSTGAGGGGGGGGAGGGGGGGSSGGAAASGGGGGGGGSFPSTPTVMTMVMHGGAQNGGVHQAHQPVSGGK